MIEFNTMRCQSVRRECTGYKLRSETVTGTDSWRQLLLIPLLALSWGACALEGESTKDPTVPPAVWLAAQPSTPGAAPQHTANAASRVQVILVGETRRLALVDGNVVKAGDVINDSKVLAIKVNRVVMEDTSKSLSMYPNVEKKAPTSAMSRKKSVVIPADSVSSKEKGSNQ